MLYGGNVRVIRWITIIMGVIVTLVIWMGVSNTLDGLYVNEYSRFK